MSKHGHSPSTETVCLGNLPYVSSRTFFYLLDQLYFFGMPNSLDRDWWGRYCSVRTSSKLVTALQFLGMVDADDRPQLVLADIVRTRGGKAETLSACVSNAYGPLLHDLKLDTANFDELKERFAPFCGKQHLLIKAVLFYANLAYWGDILPYESWHRIKRQAREAKQAEDQHKRSYKKSCMGHISAPRHLP
jgi:hypothetical protein